MSRRLKIAVADDEADTRQYVEELMRRLGHEVRAAEDGKRLVQLCAVFEPDLVITDYAMPGMDGLAAAADSVGQASGLPSTSGMEISRRRRGHAAAGWRPAPRAGPRPARLLS